MRVSAAYVQVRRNRVKALTAQHVTPADIARTLGVSVRTVERDAAESDVVVRAEREPGKNGQPCPICGRTVSPGGYIFPTHATTPGGPDYCPNSRMPLSVVEGTAGTFTRRRNQVAILADVVQDQDPDVANAYLTSLPAHEVRAIALFALAGIDLQRTKAELWPTWTRALTEVAS